MKHYFFVNPAAGQGGGTDALIGEIESSCAQLGADFEIYITGGVGDGERRAREIAEREAKAAQPKAPETEAAEGPSGTAGAAREAEAARFYACGGDGTLNEILCGAAGFDVPVGCVPTGTGNDMVRNFPDAGDFTDIRAQLRGEAKAIDLIWYAGVMDGVYRERYCANMFNIGFDCNVVELAGRLKKKPLIAGSAAYLLAVLGVFLQKKTIGLRLEEEGRVLLDRDVLLCSVANGSFCGGGIHTSPQSDVSDGVFDLNIINDVSRLEFLRLFPKYKAGTHLGVPGIEKVIQVKTCRQLSLTPKEGSFFLCADGEICVAQSVQFEIRPKALPFILPAKS